MSIADKITQLDTIRSNIRTALTDKGVTADTHDFADFATDISSISTGGLPAEYEAVEYIESTGTQYIDTGVITDKHTAVRFNYKRATIENGVLFGSGSSGLASTYFIATGSGQTISCYQPYGNAGVKYDDNGTVQYILTFGAATYALSHGTSIYLLNAMSSYYGFPAPQNYTNTNLLSLYFCATNEDGTAKEFSKIRIYGGTQIYNNSTGEMYRNFVPCKRISDDEAGLYDLVNGVFYTNQGTGDFVVPT